MPAGSGDEVCRPVDSERSEGVLVGHDLHKLLLAVLPDWGPLELGPLLQHFSQRCRDFLVC